MHYISTRGQSEPLPFGDAVLGGLARDGGLLLPETLPDIRDRLDDWRSLSYPDLAAEVMGLFAGDLSGTVLRGCIHRAYARFRHPAITPVRHLGELFLLELFHGPTLAFKDLALQMLGHLFAELLGKAGRELNIVAATSGDTGSAAIHGVRGLPGIRIFVLHPRGRVSPIQERQMTTVTDPNVFNLAVDGSFDDCQAMVKALFNDLAFRDRYALGAVNSINIARVLAQVVYYVYATFRVQALTGAKQLCFAVPTGNFGDIFAGYLARRMGLPIAHLILASNENDILPRFFETGQYCPRTVVPTLSPSMDIQVASNFERYLFDLSGQRPSKLRTWMKHFQRDGVLDLRSEVRLTESGFKAGRTARAETLTTIRRYYHETGILLDPHTAVGVQVAERFNTGNTPIVCLATAHPAKFPDVATEALGHTPPEASHPLLNALRGQPTRVETLPADAATFADCIASVCNRAVPPL